MTSATILYPLHDEHAAYREHRPVIRTALRHYLSDLRAIAHRDDYCQRRPRDFGLSMRRQVLAGEMWRVRRALRGTR
jgi:hypothetical protein